MAKRRQQGRAQRVQSRVRVLPVFEVPAFSIRLRDKNGRYIKSTHFGKAASYELWLSRKRLIPLTLIPKYRKTAAAKRDMLKKLLSRLIRKSQIAFEKKVRARERARKKRNRIRREATLNRLKSKARKGARAEAHRLIKQRRQIEEEFSEDIEAIDEERPDRKAAYLEQSPYQPDKSDFEPSLVTPIITPADDYEKEYITKIVRSDRFGANLHLKILNFTLKEPFETTDVNFDLNKEHLMAKFVSHVKAFYDEAKGTERRFIFRVKYDTVIQKEGKNEVRSQGVSDMGRIHAIEFEHLLEFVTGAFLHLGDKLGNYLARSMTGAISLTGFTLENIEKFG
jgi:hypothetical protein